MKFLKVKNPRYGAADETVIDLVVTLEDGRDVDYTANGDDLLFQAAKSGEYGTIQPFAPVELSVADKAKQLSGIAKLACAYISTQIDQTRAAAYQNAYMMIASTGAPPIIEPAKTIFNNFASQSAGTPEEFASQVLAVAMSSISMSTALAALETSANAATTDAELQQAVNIFNGAALKVVADMNASGLYPAITAPPALA